MNKKTVGILLLWTGFLSGALATIWQAPKQGVAFSKTLRSPNSAIPDIANEISFASVVGSLARSNSMQSQAKSLKSPAAMKIVEDFTPHDLSEITVGEDGWHLVNWVWYGLSAAVAVAGIVLIRQGNSAALQKSEKSQASLAEITACLNQLVLNVGQLAKDAKHLAPSKILHRIDDELSEDLMTFADGRESITTEYGLSVFADVMSNFASGERSINRAWCAAADSYVNEAETCLVRGEKMLRAAYEVLEKA